MSSAKTVPNNSSNLKINITTGMKSDYEELTYSPPPQEGDFDFSRFLKRNKRIPSMDGTVDLNSNYIHNESPIKISHDGGKVHKIGQEGELKSLIKVLFSGNGNNNNNLSDGEETKACQQKEKKQHSDFVHKMMDAAFSKKSANKCDCDSMDTYRELNISVPDSL